MTRPNGEVISFSYGTTTGVLNSVGVTSGTYDYVWNPDRTLKSLTSPTGLKIEQSWSMGNLNSEKVIDASSGSPVVVSELTRYAATGIGKILSEVIDSGPYRQIINYAYNRDEQIVSAGEMTLTYDDQGLLSSTSLGVVSDESTYNSFGEVAAYLAKVNGSVVYGYALSRDTLGRVVSKTELFNGELTTYDYTFDRRGRLTRVMKDGDTLVRAMSYDPNGNRIAITRDRVTSTAAYDSQDRLITDGVFSYAYNANGELTAKTNLTTTAVTSFSFNEIGQQVSSTTNLVTTQWVHDGLGRKILQKVTGLVKPRWKFTYRMDGSMAAMFEGNSNARKYFVYASKATVPDFYSDENNIKYRIIADSLARLG